MTTETKPRRSRAKKIEDPVEEIVATGVDVSEAEAMVEKQELAVASSPAVMSEGIHALAMLTDEEFQSRLQVLKQGRDRVAIMQRELMIEGEDYGLIPGTPKPTLFKSGAEKLCLMYRLAARLEVERIDGDNEHTPPITYHAQCFLHLGSLDGQVVATGHGNANGWEKRYLRGASKTCPQCGQAALIKSKYRKETWHCFAKKGGCGADIPFNHPDLEGQAESKGAVTDAHDLANTLMKMAEKRAFVDATLRATGTSGLFTQDVVEDPRDDEDTVTTRGGAVVDTSTGEVRGREDSGYYEKHGTNPNEQALDDEQSASSAEQVSDMAPYVATGDEVEKVLRQPDPMADDEPEFRKSDVEGIGRGGVTDGPTTAQLETVKSLSKGIVVSGQEKPGLGPWRLADEIAIVVGGGIDSTTLDDDRGAAGRQVEAFLKTMSGNDVGTLIAALRRMSEAGA